MTAFFQSTRPFSWSLYSKKLIDRIEQPKSAGILTQEEADEKDLRRVIGADGSIEDGNYICFYWFLDKNNGTITDVRFQCYGHSALIGASQAAADLIVGKNYDQVTRITADLLDKELRDRESEPAFPKEAYPHLNLVLGAIENASTLCTDLPLPDFYVSTPLPVGEIVEGGFPGWLELPLKKKLAVIEEVLDREVRPYIALDAGGVEVIDLLQDKEVVITYQGSCTSCYSSIGTTLSFIQHMLRAKVHPDIIVTPNM